jgi:hypothetical protein
MPTPEPIKLVADKVLLVLSHVKFTDWSGVEDLFPINIRFAVNVVVPIPPLESDNVPDAIFEAFKAGIPLPESIKLVDDDVLLVLSQVKFDNDVEALVPLPINNCPAVNDGIPIPPLETDNVPDVIFDAFKLLLIA